MRLVLLIKIQASPNASQEMNEETIFSHWNIYNALGYNIGCSFNIIYNRMSVAIVSILLLEIFQTSN